MLETTQKARWFQISKFETTVKPLWFHKKRQLSKISLEIVIYCVKKYHILKIPNQIFLNFIEKQSRVEFYCEKLVKGARKECKSTINWSIFSTLKPKKGSFFTFWKTQLVIVHFWICNLISNPPMIQPIVGIIWITMQMLQKWKQNL